MKIYTYLTLILIILSGCGIVNDTYLEKKSENLKGEGIEIINLSEVSKNDEFKIVNANIISPYINSYGYYFCLDLKARYINLKYGELSLAFSRRALIDNLNFDSPVYSNVEKVSKNNLQLMYSLPLISRNVTRLKEIGMKKTPESPNTRYYTILKTNLLKKMNFRFGFDQVYSETNSYIYTKFLLEKYNNVHFNESDVTRVDALVCQNIKMIKLGLSTQKIINTTFNAFDNYDNKYYGQSTAITDVYFDINFLLNSRVGDVEYNYSVYEPGPYFGMQVNENVDFANYIKKNSFGFSFGIERNRFDLNHPNFCHNVKFEFTISPGYFDSSFKAFSMKFSMSGLGFRKK